MIDTLEIIKAYPLTQEAYELQAYRRTLEDFLNSHGLTISIEPVVSKRDLSFFAKIFHLQETYSILGFSSLMFGEEEFWDETKYWGVFHQLKIFENYEDAYEIALEKCFQIIEEKLLNNK